MNRRFLLLAAAVALACRGAEPGESGAAPLSDGEDHPPVLVNSESPVQYPPELYARQVEGEVVLKLFVDAEGHVHPDSTDVAESSGELALDSAAVAAVPRFRFVPALRNGEPVGTTFLQPVQFRHPDRQDAP